LKGFWAEDSGLRYVRLEPDDGPAELPVIFSIHGRGAAATDLAGLAPEIGEGYRWILPQGPRPVPLAPGYVGWAWYELGSAQAETAVSSRDMLAAFVDDTLGRLNVSHERAMLMGFSQGAVMSLHVGLASAKPLAGIAAMSGYLPAAEALKPLLADRRDRSVLMVHGTLDETLGIELGRSARDLLEKAGLVTEYHEFNMGHQITPESLAVVRDYVHRVLPGVEE
jgi:phospholipase/carboxylesterase